MSEEMNLYKRCKNIFKSHGVDMGGGGSGGLQYDFVIVSEDGATFHFEKGTYASITTKIQCSPVLGVVQMHTDELTYNSTNYVLNVIYTCVDPDEGAWVLSMMVYGAETGSEFQLIINEDNTIELA